MHLKALLYSDLVRTFENGSKLKISSEIAPPLSFPSRLRTSESDSLSWVNFGKFFILVKSGKSSEFSSISAGNDTERGADILRGPLLNSGGSSIS